MDVGLGLEQVVMVELEKQVDGWVVGAVFTRVEVCEHL